MALTVLKYRKGPEGTTVGTTGGGAGILIKSSKIQQQQNLAKKPIIKLEGGGGIVINKIQTGSKPMKRTSTTVAEPAFKAAKFGNKQYSLQTITSSGTPLTSFDGKLYSIQQNTSAGGGALVNAITANKKQIIRAATASANVDNNGTTASPTNAFFSNATSSTPIKLASNAIGDKKFALPFIQSNGTTIHASTTGAGTALQLRRPTIYIKREAPAKTIRSITIELIEKNPYIHLGVTADRLGLLKQVVCTTTSVPVIHLYMTLKKLRQNEEFALLAEYFELSESEVQKIFTRTVVKLAKYLKFLIRWPESKKYYDRHKNLPIAFRSKLSYVQSMIECVETDIQQPLYQNGMEPIECANYKFVLTITPTGVISYVSDAYVGHNDDLAIFNACDFQSVIPKYLSLVADPGKAIRRKRKPNKRSSTNVKTDSNMESTEEDGNVKSINTTTSLAVGATQNRTETDSTTDSADESDSDDDATCEGKSFNKFAAVRAADLSSHNTLNVVNSELTSRKVKDFSIPTVRVRESVCRLQIRHLIYCLREFKVLQPYAILEPVLYQYINEILVIAAALTNLQR